LSTVTNVVTRVILSFANFQNEGHKSCC